MRKNVFKTVVLIASTKRRNGGAEDQLASGEEALRSSASRTRPDVPRTRGIGLLESQGDDGRRDYLGALQPLRGRRSVVLDPLPGLDAEALMDLRAWGGKPSRIVLEEQGVLTVGRRSRAPASASRVDRAKGNAERR